MVSTPPPAALAFFRNPVILSQAIVAGVFRETGVDSYGICLSSKQVSIQVATQLSALIRTNIMHVSAFYQLKSPAGDVKYYLAVIPREDVALARPYITLCALLRQQDQLDWDQYITVMIQLLELLNIFSRLGFVHGAICPDNIFISTINMNVRLGVSMPFAAYLIDVERAVMTTDIIHSYDMCIPPECFLVYKSTINFAHGNVDAWMIGATLLYAALSPAFVESHFTPSYRDYRVELITFLFHAIGPPHKLGSLPLQREAEEKLISSFEYIVPYLSLAYSNDSSIVLRLENIRRSAVRKVILGLMNYNFNARMQPGLALEIIRRELERNDGSAGVDVGPGAGVHYPARQSTSMHAVQFGVLPDCTSSGKLKRRRSRSLSPQRHKTSAELDPAAYLPFTKQPSGAHQATRVSTLARQASPNSEKPPGDYKIIVNLRQNIDQGAITRHRMQVRDLKKNMVKPPIKSARDIQHALHTEYDPVPGVDDLIIPTKEYLMQDLHSMGTVQNKDMIPRPSSTQCDKRYAKVLRTQLSGDLHKREKELESKCVGTSNQSRALSQSLRLSSEDQGTLCFNLSQKEDSSLSEHGRGDGLFVDSMDVPLLAMTGNKFSSAPTAIDSLLQPQLHPQPSVDAAAKRENKRAAEQRVRHHSKVERVSSRSPFSSDTEDSQPHAVTLSKTKTKGSPNRICTVVLHRISTPYKAELTTDIAVELKPMGYSAQASFIGSASSVIIPEPSDFGISVPAHARIQVVSLNPALSDFSGMLTGRLIVSINTPANTCRVLSFTLGIDFRDLPKGQEWVLSSNGLASALIEVLY